MDENITTPNSHKTIAIWLFICAFMVASMVFIGGLTRLTDSGLSIVEWKPVTGVIPPLNDIEWMEEFTKYQQIPEFKLINYNMDLSGFKFIYLLEYFHRLIGRVTGLVFLLPLVYFYFKKNLKPTQALKLLLIFALGGLQGVIGWYMVKSGLSVRTDVSQYRLTLHLLTAFLIYGLIFWNGLKYWYQNEESYNQKFRFTPFISLLIILILQIASGGFVAGLNAGHIYNSFPLMDGQLIPNGLNIMSPWYKNIFENATTVQFIHRLGALILTSAVIAWLYMNKSYFAIKRLKIAVNLLIIMLIIQLSLGIYTLLSHVSISVALAHQTGALMLFSIFIYILNRIHAIKVESNK